jgi:hypothetical protein
LSTQKLKNLENPNKNHGNPDKKLNLYFLNKTRKSNKKAGYPNKNFYSFFLDFGDFCLDFHIFSGIRQKKQKTVFFGFPRHP